MTNTLPTITRTTSLFSPDISLHEKELSSLIKSSRFLVIGGAGSIGSAVVHELLKRNPKLLHIVDISETGIAELVQGIRGSFGNIDGEVDTFAIDCSSYIFDSFILNGQGYDYVLNLSAVKHELSGQDPFSLMQMIVVNILNHDKIIQQAKTKGAKKYFCISTDKTANPEAVLHTSMCIMEMFLMHRSLELPVSFARPCSITPQEAGELCLMSCLLGENRDTFFPKPVYLNTKDETLDMGRFNTIGIIKNEALYDEQKLKVFTNAIQDLHEKGEWSRTDLIDSFSSLIPDFNRK